MSIKQGTKVVNYFKISKLLCKKKLKSWLINKNRHKSLSFIEVRHLIQGKVISFGVLIVPQGTLRFTQRTRNVMCRYLAICVLCEKHFANFVLKNDIYFFNSLHHHRFRCCYRAIAESFLHDKDTCRRS